MTSSTRVSAQLDRRMPRSGWRRECRRCIRPPSPARRSPAPRPRGSCAGKRVDGEVPRDRDRHLLQRIADDVRTHHVVEPGTPVANRVRGQDEEPPVSAIIAPVRSPWASRKPTPMPMTTKPAKRPLRHAARRARSLRAAPSPGDVTDDRPPSSGYAGTRLMAPSTRFRKTSVARDAGRGIERPSTATAMAWQSEEHRQREAGWPRQSASSPGSGARSSGVAPPKNDTPIERTSIPRSPRRDQGVGEVVRDGADEEPERDDPRRAATPSGLIESRVDLVELADGDHRDEREHDDPAELDADLDPKRRMIGTPSGVSVRRATRCGQRGRRARGRPTT